MKFSAKSTAVRIGLAAAVCALLSSQPGVREKVGPLPDGGFLLNSGWRLQPAGRQIALDTLPMATALSPDGKYLLVLNCGFKPPSISVIDAASGKLLSNTGVPDAWLGLTFSPKGDRVYVGGGSRAAIYEFTLANGTLAPGRTFSVGLDQAKERLIGDVAFSPDGRLLYAADLYHDSVVVINPQSGMTIDRIPTKRRPYRILFHPDGKSFFVSHWADGSVGQYDTATGSLVGLVRIGAHPTDMVWRDGATAEPVEGAPTYTARLFVAAANTNNVYAVGVSASKELSVVESINVSMTPRQPLGMTPSALALSADGKRLFVACSDCNAAAVVDVSGERSRVEGFIPTGWYPTAVRALPSGTLVVINGKGLARPQTGTASWIEPFNSQQLDAWTKTAAVNSPYSDSKLDEPSPLPPIEHVIYIVNGSHTYDQVLGDMKEGNGDGSLTQFGEQVTPNLHKLARQFVLLDNFYVNGDGVADGRNWSTAAIAPDYVQKLWPGNYAGRRKKYDFEEQDPASLPPAGYLWTNAVAAGISVRNFGFMVDNKENAPPGGEQIARCYDPVLSKVTNRMFRGVDPKYPDVERAKVFLAEFADYEKSGYMPRLAIMRLGSAFAADNDYAIAMIAEAVSKSRFWASAAIFIVEDATLNGPDHVDAHRSLAFLISPYAKRRVVDNTMYNTTSILRTMEFLLGLHPMTQFDAGARPLTASFQPAADQAPYTAEKPRAALDK